MVSMRGGGDFRSGFRARWDTLRSVLTARPSVKRLARVR
jgi:hypothetical protein